MRISDWSSDVCSSDLELDLFHLEQFLELLDQRITGLGQDAHQGFLLKLFKSGHDGQTPNQFRYEAELDEIFGLDLGEQFAYAFFRFGAHRRREEIGRASCRERVCQYV